MASLSYFLGQFAEEPINFCLILFQPSIEEFLIVGVAGWSTPGLRHKPRAKRRVTDLVRLYSAIDDCASEHNDGKARVESPDFLKGSDSSLLGLAELKIKQDDVEGPAVYKIRYLPRIGH